MMRCCAALLLLALAAGGSVGSAAAERGTLSPVTRVVELLKALSLKIETESKTEEELYNKFVCWGKEVVSQKTATNAAAASRIEMLSTYIADLDAGRIELTSERVDLEKDIEQLRGSMEIASEIRAKEEADYKMAAEEMQQAINALTSAIEVLRTATDEHKDGVLLALRGQGRAGEAAALSRALALGDKFLTKGDALFLRRLLSGEVPTWDWKKLNRKATFKMSYKARSFKIQQVLGKLLETFSTSLLEAGTKEKEAQELFDKLMASKGAERDASQEALSKLEKENGAKGMSRESASEELGQLQEQVKADTGYIADVNKALDDKKTEWKERSALRAGEIAAISKAISIMHSDDSRDLFKKSFSSQGYSFLQEGQQGGRQQRHSDSAAAALRQAAAAAGDRRLEVIAMRAAAGGHFDQVISAIDKMLAILQTEEGGDLKKKEGCEADRAADTREAILASRTIDEMSDLISTLTTEIAELVAEIEQKEKEVAEINAQLEEAKRVREDENRAFLAAKKDDEDAHALVVEATEVLKAFYSENGLMLTQKRQAPEVAAGLAPPPPPTTWEAPYGGKTQESTGIIAVLTMIKEDITKDMATAQAAEDKAAALYKTTKQLLESERADLKAQILALEGTKGEKIEKRESTKGERRLKKGDLDIVVKKIKDAEPGCEFFTINFPARTKNRQIEVDGLLKAKAILQKAVFATPEDEGRALKPGDALLQRARRHGQ